MDAQVLCNMEPILACRAFKRWVFFCFHFLAQTGVQTHSTGPRSEAERDAYIAECTQKDRTGSSKGWRASNCRRWRGPAAPRCALPCSAGSPGRPRPTPVCPLRECASEGGAQISERAEAQRFVHVSAAPATRTPEKQGRTAALQRTAVGFHRVSTLWANLSPSCGVDALHDPAVHSGPTQSPGGTIWLRHDPSA
jgi:hypothetical protein